MVRGIVVSLAPQSRWTYSPVSVKRAGVLGEAISSSNATADTKELSVLCLRGARSSFFQRKSYHQSVSRRQTMPASDQSAQRRDIHIQVYELQNVLCHRQKRMEGGKSKQDKGKSEWLREGSWECVNIFAIFFFFHRQFPEEMSSFRVLTLFYISIHLRCFSSREIKPSCQLIYAKMMHNNCRLKIPKV